MTRSPGNQRPMRIVPHLKLRGTQLAGWTPRAVPAPGRAGIIYEEDVEIILPDGVVLRADLFRPGDGAPVPVLIAWAAYIKDGERMGGGFIIDESGSAEFIVPRGYALLRVQPRGTGRSGGASASEFYSATEIQDCRDTIDWAAGQGWCDGRVGMAGMSYFAIIQLLVAATRPPRLTAFFPLKGMTDLYRQGFYKGGAAYTGAMELMAAAEKLKPPPIPSGIRHALSHLLNRPPFLMHTSDAKANQTRFRRIMALVKPPEEACRSYVRRLFDNPYDNADWRSRSATATLENIELPICIATDYGAVGFHLFGAFELWHRVRADKRMFIGPAEYEFPWTNYHEEMLAWFDWQIKGIDNGYADLPRVRYWLGGAERWESAADWPVPGTVPVQLHLHTADPDPLAPQALVAAPPAEPSAQSFLAIPSTSYYVREIDRYEAQVLRYQTAPMADDTAYIGPVHLRLTLTSTALDTYLMARLSDVAPDGTRRKLAFGWLLASHRRIDPERSNPSEIIHDHRIEAVEALRPGSPTELSFSLTPISHLFRRGHRLLLEIGARPELLCTEKGEGFDMFLWDPVPYRARNTLHHGGATGCRLDLRHRPGS